MKAATRKPDSFSTSFLVDQTPEEVFDAVNNVRGWWTGEIRGRSAKPGDVFTFRYQDVHRSKQKLVEVVPGKKVVWLIEDAHLAFARDKEEWTGTRVVFDIARKGRKTELRFTHDGLVPEFECFDACSEGWDFYVNTSLKSLITTGKASPG